MPHYMYLFKVYAMKKNIIFLLSFLIAGCSINDKNKETREFIKFKEYILSEFLILETEKIAFLKKCSKENIYCKSMLGNAYYRIGHYDKAFELLIESQDDLKGSKGYSWAPSELALGEMYALGRGVIKNRAEAEKHFDKCALAGDRSCISWLISFREVELKEYQQNMIENPQIYNSEIYPAQHLFYWLYIQFLSKDTSQAQEKRLHEVSLIIGQKETSKWRKSAEELWFKFGMDDNRTRNLNYLDTETRIY